MDFLYIEDREEGRSIDGVNDLLQLCDLQTAHHAVEDILIILQEASLSVQAGDGAMHIMNDRIGHRIVRGRHDEDPLRRVETRRDRIDHARADEVGDEGIHRTVPAEDEAGRTKDEEIKKHDDLAHGERKFIIHPDRHDLRAICRAAALDDDADTHADDDAAKDRREERIRRRGLHRLEIGRAEREDDDRKGRRQREPRPEPPIADVEKGQVQKDDEHAEGDPRQRLHEKRNACDASVDDVIRDQEKIEARRVDGCTHGQPDGFLQFACEVDMPME